MSKICDKSVFVIFRPINTHYCHSRGCTLQHNLHSVFSQRPCSPDTYFAMQCYSRVYYFALHFSCIFNLKRIGSQVNEDDDFHNLVFELLKYIFVLSQNVWQRFFSFSNCLVVSIFPSAGHSVLTAGEWLIIEYCPVWSVVVVWYQQQQHIYWLSDTNNTTAKQCTTQNTKY